MKGLNAVLGGVSHERAWFTRYALRWLAAFALVLMVLCAAGAAIGHRVDKLKSDNERLESTLKAMNLDRYRLKDGRYDMRQAVQSGWKRMYVSRGEMSQVIKRLSDLAAEHAAVIQKVNSGTSGITLEGKPFLKINVTLEVEADYVNLAKFLDALESSREFYFNWEEVQIHTGDPQAGRVKAVVAVAFYDDEAAHG